MCISLFALFSLTACIIAHDSATDDDCSRAIQHCEKVLAIETAPKEQKEKALYRKGIALTRMRNYDAAMKCFQACSSKSALRLCRFHLSSMRLQTLKRKSVCVTVATW